MDTGRSASRRATHERSRVASSPPTVSVPSASLKYEFFTPYHRGFDLVFDFLCSRDGWLWRHEPWSIEASYGYERAQHTKVRAEDQYVGTAHDLAERFAALAPAYQRFMWEVETAATKWREHEDARNEDAERDCRQKDADLCARVLAASGIEAPGQDGETRLDAKHESPQTPKPHPVSRKDEK